MQRRGEAGRLRSGAAVVGRGPAAALHQQGHHAVVPPARAAAGRGALRTRRRRLVHGLHTRGALPQASALPGDIFMLKYF